MTDAAKPKGSIGVLGALSIGVGGIVGGGFFATFGLTIEGARGGTPVAFLIGGAIALVTAYSYIGLTLRYPGPGGTVGFLRTAFGTGLVPACPERAAGAELCGDHVGLRIGAGLLQRRLPARGDTPGGHNVIASAAIVLFGVDQLPWRRADGEARDRLQHRQARRPRPLHRRRASGRPARLDPARALGLGAHSTIVATGMLGFLAYEGFELISNASADIENPKRTLPIALLGSVVIAIVIYVLAVVVAIGHMSFEQAEASRDFAVSAAAGTFLGPIGFAVMSIGAVLASASAINADFFGAGKLPPLLAQHHELPSAFQRQVRGQSLTSLAVIGASGARRRQLRRDPRIVERDQRRLPARLRGGQPGGHPATT